jgi:hypothetical protein
MIAIIIMNVYGGMSMGESGVGRRKERKGYWEWRGWKLATYIHIRQHNEPTKPCLKMRGWEKVEWKCDDGSELA